VDHFEDRMNTIDDGGPAFPETRWDDKTRQDVQWVGMFLRDYFAAKALTGICASRDEAGTLIEHGYEWISSEAYRIADAMLLARLTRG
jgi:hypothetical protein